MAEQLTFVQYVKKEEPKPAKDFSNLLAFSPVELERRKRVAQAQPRTGLYTIIYYTPHEQPPNGFRELYCEKVFRQPLSQNFWDLMDANPDYVMAWESAKQEKPKRKMSPESILRGKKTRLINKFKKKYGMFASQMIEQEFEAKGWVIEPRDKERIDA